MSEEDIKLDIDAIDKIFIKLKSAGEKGYNLSPELKTMGDEIIKMLIHNFSSEEKSFKYAIQQLILNTPHMIPKAVEVINRDFPQYKDYLEKLLILK